MIGPQHGMLRHGMVYSALVRVLHCDVVMLHALYGTWQDYGLSMARRGMLWNGLPCCAVLLHVTLRYSMTWLSALHSVLLHCVSRRTVPRV